MNHEIMMRFRIIKNGHVVEATLDDRLSFKENLRILGEISGELIMDAEVYDPMKRIFLDKEVPLNVFSFEYFVSLYLFT